MSPHAIQPGKPVQDCFIESFNGALRDEFPDMRGITNGSEESLAMIKPGLHIGWISFGVTSAPSHIYSN